jgi:hypothetical protein
MTVPHPENVTPIGNAADTSQASQDRPEYVSGREGLAIVKNAGIGIGPELWYRMLAEGKVPGQVQLGRRYWVPADVVRRMAESDN